MKKDKVIIYCGTFDPVHKGHMLVAESAADMLDADVIFVPAKNDSWKKPVASVEDRLAMLKLAIKDDPRFSIDAYEIESLDTPYTIYTAEHFKSMYPDSKIYLVLGGDQVNEFHKWYMAKELSKTVKILYFDRKDVKTNFENVVNFNMYKIPSDVTSDISSTQFKGTKDMSMLSKDVASYIKEKHLYGC